MESDSLGIEAMQQKFGRCAHEPCQQKLREKHFTIRGHSEIYCSAECLNEHLPVKWRRDLSVATPSPPPVDATNSGASESKGNTRPIYDLKDHIKVLITGNPFRGTRADRYTLLQDGMTVKQFSGALDKAGYGPGLRMLTRAIEAGLVELSKAVGK